MIRASQLFVVSLLMAFVVSSAHAASEATAEEPPTVEAVAAMVNEYCGSCHGVPPPGLMPKRSWPKVIQAMADLSAERMGREFIPPEAVRHITALYVGSSPEERP